jgi:hypothetical protein
VDKRHNQHQQPSAHLPATTRFHFPPQSNRPPCEPPTQPINHLALRKQDVQTHQTRARRRTHQQRQTVASHPNQCHEMQSHHGLSWVRRTPRRAFRRPVGLRRWGRVPSLCPRWRSTLTRYNTIRASMCTTRLSLAQAVPCMLRARVQQGFSAVHCTWISGTSGALHVACKGARVQCRALHLDQWLACTRVCTCSTRLNVNGQPGTRLHVRQQTALLAMCTLCPLVLVLVGTRLWPARSLSSQHRLTRRGNTQTAGYTSGAG